MGKRLRRTFERIRANCPYGSNAHPYISPIRVRGSLPLHHSHLRRRLVKFNFLPALHCTLESEFSGSWSYDDSLGPGAIIFPRTHFRRVGRLSPSKMAAKPAPSLSSIVSTSIALCDRFSSSLSPNASLDVPPSNAESPSPLLLLNAAATTLRSQVTKISLLAINAPFTPSAVATCLQPLNESILTSLVTAALLTTPHHFTTSFSLECRSLAGVALKDLQGLLRLVQRRSEVKNNQAEISELEKKEFTETTGRVWDDCDKLAVLAKEGVPGYVVRKSKQWLELMKDAVKELEDWDPQEEVDDNDLFGDESSDDEAPGSSDETTDDDDRVAISTGVKIQALKVLSRIPQSIHVVIKQRLEKHGNDQQLSTNENTRLGTILLQTRQISELIDESAEGMYLGDLERCLKKAGEARAITIQVVESVAQPISEVETKEDKYVQRALQWIQQVDPGDVSRENTVLTNRPKVNA